jgi:DNA invertase Pin-like site-specific DNA recombinase
MFTSPLALIVVSLSRRDVMIEAIGYVQVSREEQADSGLGLQAQRQRIVAFCAMEGPRLAEVDVACSAFRNVDRWKGGNA